MKITRMYLENFIGIYAGTGKTVLDVDFTKSKNKITVLSGQNGSGKSTFMSLCHPLRGTLDNRSDIIIPNSLGHSICEMTLDDGRKCVTEHYYGKKNKSFISVDGKELNENGSIRSFETIAKDVLGIDSDYFRIGKLGSNVSNFIDLSTTQRKTYLNQFIPAVDDYLTAYDIVNEKYKTVNTEVKVIKENIEKYSRLRELSSIEEHLEELNESLAKYQDELAKKKTAMDKDITMYEMYSEDIKELIEKAEIEDFENLDIDSLTIEVIAEIIDNVDEANESSIAEYMKYINDFCERYKILPDDKKKSVEGLLKKNELKINTIENKIETIASDINKTKDLIIEYKNNIQKMNNEKADNGIDDDFSEDEINETISSNDDSISIIKFELEKTENEINDLVSSDENITEEDKNKFKYLIDNVFNQDIRNKLKSHIYILSSSLEERIFNQYDQDIIDEYNEGKLKISDIDEIQDRLNQLTDAISDTESEIKKNQKFIDGVTVQKEFVEKNLAERPENCKIDSCSFIKDSVDFIKVEEPKAKKLAKNNLTFEDNLKNLKEASEAYESRYDFLTDLLDILNKFKNNLKSLIKNLPKIDISYLSLFLDSEGNLNDYVTSSILSYRYTNTLPYINLTDILLDNIVRYNNMKTLEENSASLKKQLETFSKIDKINKSYERLINKELEKVETANNTISELQDNLDECETNKKTLNKRILICKDFLSKYAEYEECLKAKDTLKTITDTLKDKFKMMDELSDYISNYKERISALNTLIKSTSDEIQTTTTSITLIKDNLERLSEIEGSMKNLELVKKALDPKSGIPLVFINSFLTSISMKANRLLKLAYDDSFVIHFDVTAKDFKIQVFKSDGTSLNDINEGSQGEQSLTSTSLSLAMIENVIKPGAFNIIYLDEIDATLSTENRRIFIDILEKQLDELNCEQCFIITHNGEFYNHDVDLMLFRGHDCDLNDEDFMKNKKVLLNI